MAGFENGGRAADTVSLQTVGSQFDEESSLGSDSEMNGYPSSRQTDKYGFIGGAQKYSAESAQDVPPEVLRQREVKWLDMLNHWDKWINKRFNKLTFRRHGLKLPSGFDLTVPRESMTSGLGAKSLTQLQFSRPCSSEPAQNLHPNNVVGERQLCPALC